MAATDDLASCLRLIWAYLLPSYCRISKRWPLASLECRFWCLFFALLVIGFVLCRCWGSGQVMRDTATIWWNLVPWFLIFKSLMISLLDFLRFCNFYLLFSFLNFFHEKWWVNLFWSVFLIQPWLILSYLLLWSLLSCFRTRHSILKKNSIPFPLLILHLELHSEWLCDRRASWWGDIRYAETEHELISLSMRATREWNSSSFTETSLVEEKRNPAMNLWMARVRVCFVRHWDSIACAVMKYEWKIHMSDFGDFGQWEGKFIISEHKLLPFHLKSTQHGHIELARDLLTI